MDWIKDLTRERLSSLGDGTHTFAIVGPDGGRQSVRLYVSGNRRKIRCMQWDLWPCEWNVGTTSEALDFVKSNETYWEDNRSSIPHGRLVIIPHVGGTVLTLYALQKDVGEWLWRAKELLSNPQDLVSIVGLL
jgi:hypothetical protein